MAEVVRSQKQTDLLGHDETENEVERAALTAALYAQLKDLTLEEFCSCFINRFDALISYVRLCGGAPEGQQISLLFNPHRLDTGTKRFPRSLYQAFKDESFISGLARVVNLNIKKAGGIKKVGVEGLFYACVGIGVQGTSYVQEFPPHVARELARYYQLSTSSHVLDPCGGWGGRMLGFSAVVNSYTCCEPSSRTAAGLRKLLTFIQSFRHDFNATIFEAPFEDVQLQNGQFDFALTSPPYFDTERYAPGEATNSFNRYATFQAWCDGFYAPLIHRTMAALKPDAYFVINIGSRLYPLNEQLFKIAAGRYHVEKQRGHLSASNGLGKDGEGETFYELRNPPGAIVLLDASCLTTVELSSTIEAPPPAPVAAAATVASVSISALDFARAAAAVSERADAAQTSAQTTDAASSSVEEAKPLPIEQTVSADERSTLDIALDLRARGHAALTRDGKLFMTNASQLTDDDRATIKQHYNELLAIAQQWETPEPPVAEPTATLAQFLDAQPRHVDVEYTPDEPPSLDGIDEVVLNFATTGLDWAHGHRPVGITVSTLDGQMTRFLPFAFQGGGNLDEAVVKRWAERELRNKRIINANTRFDIHHARVWGIDLEAQGDTFSDIQHTAALLDDTRRKFAIDVLAADFLPDNVEVARVDESRHAEYHAADVDARERYTAQLVARLRAVMYPELDKQDLRRVQALEDAVIPVVVEMEKNAAPIDRPLLKQWLVETEQKLNEYLWEVTNAVGFAVNPDSNDDLVKLFERLHIPIGGTSATGKASFTDKILKSIDNRYVQLVRKAGKLASLRSKFLVAYDEVVGDDCLLRYQLHQLRGDNYGTVRGRFSASDKNIEQVMNRDTHMESFGSEEYFVRKLFIADTSKNPKALFLSVDAAQIEFRLFAHFSNSERLLAEYRKNPEISFHRVAEGLVKPYRADMPYTKIKSMNFLFVYGGGRSHAAEYLELPQDIANQFCDIYHRAFPEVKMLLKKAETVARERGYVKSIFGRRARFADPAFAYKALNAVIQPTAADIFKMKLVELHNERKWTGFTMRAPNHDEVIGDAFDHESAERVKTVLNRQSFAELKVPILWSGKSGHSWADCK